MLLRGDGVARCNAATPAAPLLSPEAAALTGLDASHSEGGTIPPLSAVRTVPLPSSLSLFLPASLSIHSSPSTHDDCARVVRSKHGAPSSVTCTFGASRRRRCAQPSAKSTGRLPALVRQQPPRSAQPWSTLPTARRARWRAAWAGGRTNGSTCSRTTSTWWPSAAARCSCGPRACTASASAWWTARRARRAATSTRTGAASSPRSQCW